MTNPTNVTKLPNKIVCKIGAHYDGVYLLEGRTKKELASDLLDTYSYCLVMKEQIDTLYDAIKHGDKEHKEWLKEAIYKHFEAKLQENSDAN